MNVEACMFILFLWTLFGAVFYAIVHEYVRVGSCKFYKKTIVRLISGPAIMVFTFVPDMFGWLVSWLKE